MNFSYGSNGFNDPAGVYPVYGEWGNAILTKYTISQIHNTQVEYVNKWEKRSMIDAKLMINDSTPINVQSLHYLPTEEGVSNTVKYLTTIENPILLMGDFNIQGEIEKFNQLGLLDSDSNYTTHIIDRIFYSSQAFKRIQIGTVIDTNYTSDHKANYSILKLK